MDDEEQGVKIINQRKDKDNLIFSVVLCCIFLFLNCIVLKEFE